MRKLLPRNLTRNTASGCIMARIRRDGVLHSRNFSLVEFGTWAKAQAAASEWLDEVKATLPEAASTRDLMTARNASGVVGVMLKTLERGGDTSYSWHAFWPGHTSGTRWGIDKYGDNGAFVRACLSRKLETADRDEVENAFAAVKGTAQYRSLLRNKQLEVN
ncbi:hypothetical protein [Solilutibacter silvestris]|uniref:Uncharacterized protein n=1 Tax=Solilutibacter silvestris TaxID=1645665 RepID=A0A2K1PY02_9GAMM|nr:hypothetical protein [Lysobacter silvestris]PNS07670.1 hypothetical protein Lysil_1846 [Lysobacter silvestris]